jgi:hypothetical protein
MSYFEKYLRSTSKKISKQYRIDELVCYKDLVALLNSDDQHQKTLKQLQKSSQNREKIKKYLKKLYYQKRCYYQYPEAKHISLVEREPFQKEWRDFLKTTLKDKKTVLDLACGEFPSLIPFEALNLTHYTAIDKNIKSLNNLSQLPAYVERLSYEISQEIPPSLKSRNYEIGLALQTIPVFMRQHGSSILQTFKEISCETWLISCAHRSLVKGQDIRQREEFLLTQAVEQLNWKVLTKSIIGHESIWICQP